MINNPPFFHDENITLYNVDVIDGLKQIEPESVQCVVTSPPYWGLRDYGVAGQIGLETSLDEYLDKMVSVFREVERVLKDNGTVWLNLGDSYATDYKGCGGASIKQLSNAASFYNVSRKFRHGLKPKDLTGMPCNFLLFPLQYFFTYNL